MVRASLPIAGVAATLLFASVAFGQMPQFSADPPVLYLTPSCLQSPWQPPGPEQHPLLDMMGLDLIEDDVQLTSFELTADDKAPRLTPTPTQTKEPAGAGSAGGCPIEMVEEFNACPCYVPVPYFLPSPYQGCSGHKCHRKRGCGHGGCQGGPYPGGYAAGYGSPWGWGGGMGGFGGCGMEGCCGGFYPPPYPQQQGCCSGRKCHRKQGGCHGGGGCCPRCGYSGYGNPGCGGGGCGYGGCGFGGYGAGYGGGYGYPVPGWSTMNDGFNGFTDPNCFGGKQGCCHGLFHRKCHNQPQGPPPCPYWPAPQPCCGMDGCCPF